MKKNIKTFISLLMCISILLSAVACNKNNSSLAKHESSSAKESVKENLYEAANHEWIKSHPVNEQNPAVSVFDDLEKNVNKILKKEIEQLENGTTKPSNPEEEKLIRYSKIAKNYEKRNADGLKVIKLYLEKIENMKSISDFQNIALEWTQKKLALPLVFSMEQDGKDATKNALYMRVPLTYLQKGEGYEQQAEAYKNAMSKLVKLAGYRDEDAKKITENAVKFDSLLENNITEMQDDYTPASSYNPKTIDEIKKFSKNLDFEKLFKDLSGKDIKRFSVEDMKYYGSLDLVFNDENLENLKSWLITGLILNSAELTSEEACKLKEKFEEEVYGYVGTKTIEEKTFNEINFTFGHVVGNMYGKKYFGEEAKKDVTNMVKEMIDIYKEKLENNTWLSKETIANAIKKLDTMGIQVGYPEDYGQEYRDFKVDDQASYFENYTSFSEISQKLRYENINEDVDKNAMDMAGYTVNAYYSPSSNKVVFPAAMFQAPFYDKNRSKSANFGAIGAIIGHEISHAFDINGAGYDENGNISSWWTEEDYKKFEEKTKAMVDQWKELEFAGQKLNSEQLLAENIADNGGLSVALEATKKLEDANLEEFFKSWASVWASNQTPEYAKFATENDTHAPKPLRANIQAQNMDEFYETFGITESDPMYRAPEKRVKIW